MFFFVLTLCFELHFCILVSLCFFQKRSMCLENVLRFQTQTTFWNVYYVFEYVVRFRTQSTYCSDITVECRSGPQTVGQSAGRPAGGAGGPIRLI